jgi:hypothetical protein
MVSDRAAEAASSEAALRATAAPAAERLYTCVAPGSGSRMALDRDADGAWNGDELLAGTDPADAGSHFVDCEAPQSISRVTLRRSASARGARLKLRAVLPAGAAGDPTIAGFSFALRDAADRLVLSRVIGPEAWIRLGRGWSAAAQGWVARATLTPAGAGAVLKVEAADPPAETSLPSTAYVEAGPSPTSCAGTPVACRTRGSGAQVTCR